MVIVCHSVVFSCRPWHHVGWMMQLRLWMFQAEEDDLMEKRKRSRYDLAEEEFRNLLDRKIRSPLEFSWKDWTF